MSTASATRDVQGDAARGSPELPPPPRGRHRRTWVVGGGVLALVLAAAVVAVIQGGTTHGLLPLQTFDAGDGAFAITLGEAAGGSLGYEDQALVLRCDDGNVGAGAALNREAWSIAFATDARVRAGTGSILLVVGEGGGAGAMFEVDVISSYAALWSQGSIVA